MERSPLAHSASMIRISRLLNRGSIMAVTHLHRNPYYYNVVGEGKCLGMPPRSFSSELLCHAGDGHRDAARRRHFQALDLLIAAGAIERLAACRGAQFGATEALGARRRLAQFQNAPPNPAAHK